MGANTYQTPAALATIKEILDLIADKPRTIHYLARVTRKSPRTIRGYLGYLRKHKRAYIATWPRMRGAGTRIQAQPAFRAGSHEDAPKPPPLTEKQIIDAYRARAKKNPDKYPGYSRAVRRSNDRNARGNRLALLRNIPDPMVRAAVANGLVDYRPYARRLTPEESKEAASLREQGWTFREIGNHFGISLDSARHHYRKHAQREQ